MPQEIIEVGFNEAELSAQQKRVVQMLTQIYDLMTKLDGTKISPINVTGFTELNKAVAEQNKALTDLNKVSQDYAKTQLLVAKANEANAKSKLADAKSESETIKQIELEIKAQEALERQAKKTAAAKSQALSVNSTPQATTALEEAAILEGEDNRRRSLLNQVDQGGSKYQTEAAELNALNAEKGEAAAVNNVLALSTDKLTAELQQEVAVLIENEAALAANKAAQKALLADITANGVATEKQTADLVALKTEQYALGESIVMNRSNVKALTREFIADEGSIIELRAQVLRLTNQYEALSAAEKQAQFGLNLKTQINTLQPALLKAEGELGKFQRNVGNYSSGLTKFFSGAFSYVRQLAYILPGIGIAGILGGVVDGIISIIKTLTQGEQKIHLVDQTIKGTTASSEALKTSLKELGENAEDIADGAFKKLDEATKHLQDQLGETPDAVEVAQGALIILENQAESLDKKLRSLSNIPQSGIDIGGSTTAAREKLESEINKTNQKIAEGNKKVLDERLKQQQVNSVEIGKVRAKEIQDLAQLEIEANDKIIADDKNAYGVKISALKDNLTKQLTINRTAHEVELGENRGKDAKIAAADEKFRIANLKAQADYTDKLIQLNKKAAEASFGDQKAVLQFEIEKANKIRDNDSLLYTFRNEAAQKSSDLVIKLVNLELSHRKVTATEARIAIEKNEQELNDRLEKIFKDRFKLQAEIPILSPNEQSDADLKALEEKHKKGLISEKEYQLQLAKIQADAFNNLPYAQQVQKQLDTQKKVNDEIIKAVEAAGEDRQNIIAKQQAEEQIALESKYSQGLINREQYERGLADLTVKYGKESLKASIEVAEQQLKLLDPMSDAYRKLAAEIAKAKAALAGLRVEASDNSLKNLVTDLEKAADAGQKLGEVLTTIADISFNNQRAELEELAAQEEKNYEQQQANIERTAQSDQDRADQLTILDSEHAANQERIARRQREIDNRKAEFDKAVAIMNIILGTAVSIAKADTLIEKIAFAALGAAQLAAAIATKVPHYAEGLNDAKEDHIGMVGEGKYAELVERPGKRPVIASKATYMFLPKHSRVIPLKSDINEMANRALGSGSLIVAMSQQPTDESWDIARWQISQMKKMQPARRSVKNGYGFREAMYIAKNIKHTA